MLAWSQLGWHQKPFGLLNIAGFYSQLIAFLNHTAAEGFIRPKHRELVLVEDRAEKILQRMKNFCPPNEVKWAVINTGGQGRAATLSARAAGTLGVTRLGSAKNFAA